MIEQTDQRLFKVQDLAELGAFMPTPFTGWTYAELESDNTAYRWNSTTSKWEPLGATAGKYFVNVAGQQPETIYNTIPDAIAAAFADGHGQLNPTTILVYPGTYPEDIVLRSGINLQGLQEGASQGWVFTQSPVNITGKMTFSPDAAFDELSLANLRVELATADGILLNGLPAVLQIKGCQFLQHGAAFVSMRIKSATSFVDTTESLFINDAGGTAVVSTGAAVGLSFNNCGISDNGTSTHLSLQMTLGTLYMTGSDVQGQTSLGDPAITGHTIRGSKLHGATLPALTIALGGVVDISDSDVLGNSAPVISGGGTFLASELSFTGLSAIDPAMIQSPRNTVFQHSKADLSPVLGVVTITNWSDLMRIDGGGGVITCLLPACNTVPQGAHGVIKSVSVAASTINVTPFGTETIDELAAAVQILSLKGFVVLQNLGAGIGWQVVGQKL